MKWSLNSISESQTSKMLAGSFQDAIRTQRPVIRSAKSFQVCCKVQVQVRVFLISYKFCHLSTQLDDNMCHKYNFVDHLN